MNAKTVATVKAVVLFLIVSSPMTYRLTNSVLGPLVGPLVAPCGCPTLVGLAIHAAVFGVAVRWMMG